MNRSEYIAQLTAALRGKLAFDEIEDIVRDYQEFFDEGNTCPERLRELLTEGQKLEPSVLRHVLEVIKDLNRKQEKRKGP